ncbi:hypothetical protein CDL15_Pgr007250 [Punica granatum]|uniref:Uncharacterized protein n=1 Tax=Punica granatum TaxID=22663 RepID=A0A218X932_PUNGR|nr:hypothetical protein CDL15_Pgr007250 [Punica granatum]
MSTFLTLLLASSLLVVAQKTYNCTPREGAPAPAGPVADTSFTRDSCRVTGNKDLCHETLSIYAFSVQSNPWKLCNRAIWLSYQATLNVSWTLSGLSKSGR